MKAPKVKLADKLAHTTQPPQPVCYLLRSENLSNIGMMGQHATTNFAEYYSSIQLAKDAAAQDYGQPIPHWQTSNGHHTSGDLRYVMYDIIPIFVEK
jgi:hypothetical protein